MSIIVCGINHKTAPIALREKVYFSLEKVPFYLQDLLNSGLVREAVLLSTCNRSELYCETDNISAIKAWFCQQFVHDLQEEALYLYQDRSAVEHIMNVACGLDSMVLGEPEILGQVKAAFSESCSAGAVGSSFHRLFQQVFAIAKEIRSTTSVGACPVSIASTTITLVKKCVTPFAAANIILLGAGDMVELILRYLQVYPVKKTWIVNRNVEKAQALADKYGGEACSLSEIANVLPHANVMITATGSLEPIITAAMLEAALQDSKEPLFIFDIAVPRDVEPKAASLAMIKLHSIDDLKTIIQDNQMTRQHAAEKAQEVIKKKSEEVINNLASQDQVSNTIRAYREQIEALCASELEKALRQLANQQDAETVLRYFAYNVTNKLLHAPSAQLRQAGSEGRLDILRLAKQLLVLPELETKVI